MEQLAYTGEEVAQLLGTARSATYIAVGEGRIPAGRKGRRWLILLERLHAWLNGEQDKDAA